MRKEEFVSLLYILALLLLVTILEFTGVGAIFPYIKIITNQEIIYKNTYLHHFYVFFDFSSSYTFTIFIGLLILFTVILKAVLSFYSNYKQMSFTSQLSTRISYELLSKYLNTDISNYTKTNTAHLSKHLLFDIDYFSGSVNAMLRILLNASICFALLCLIIVVQPGAAIYSALIVSGLLFLAIKMTSKKIKKIAKSNELNKRNVYKLADEALKGMKDIRIYNRSSYFIQRFCNTQKILAKQNVVYGVVANLPLIFINTLGISSILIMTIFSLIAKLNIMLMLPTLAIVAVSIQRLMPSLGQLSNSVGMLRQRVSAGEIICNLLLEGDNNNPRIKQTLKNNSISFERSIIFDKICFSYGSKIVLDKLCLQIRSNSITGIIGESGSGKSSLIDVLLGLYPLNSGHIYIDNEEIREGILSANLNKKIAYVSQFPFILDASIKDNIMFGSEFDSVKLKNAVEVAQISKFLSGFADGLDYCVGESACHLSGGEKQRIGIARGLYISPDILILDESTSALDSDTEKQLFDALLKWANGKKTIIIVSHRHTLFDYCDNVYLIKNGKASVSVSEYRSNQVKI